MNRSMQLRKVKKYFSILERTLTYNHRPIDKIYACACDYKTDNVIPADDAFVQFENGAGWGNGYTAHSWFKLDVAIPEDMKGDRVRLCFGTEGRDWNGDNPELLAYVNGKMIQGLDINHRYIDIDHYGDCEVVIYACTGWKKYSAEFYAELCNVRSDAEQLYYDIKVPLGMLDFLNENSREYAKILCYLYNAVSLFDVLEIGSDAYFNSLKNAREYLQTEFYGNFCHEQDTTVAAIGHTHIDCAWLWTLKQTKEKVQRSFSTVLELMRQYPEYKFMSSQALLYKFLKEEAPEVYEKVKEMVKEGRWEVEGSMWVEADCNLSSGESLVRQILYGKKFFRNEFGVENRILWLPDVFGYSAALPQILKKSGVDWFVTSKISWNDTNQMPYDTFKWYGIDGTAINTYFLTAQNQDRNPPKRYTTYVGQTDPQMIAGTYNRYSQKELSDEALLTFGYGDGGGGATAEHLEMARREAMGIPGLPNLKHDFAGNFLSRLEKNIENNRLLPSWRGELYLEYHRGTYTSIAKNKRNNRKAEFLYLDAELNSTLANELLGCEFPKKTLLDGWEKILTNQFHDIIPGSSIRQVYEQSDIDYKEVFENGNAVNDIAKQSIAANIDSTSGFVVFNPNSYQTDGSVVIDGKTVWVKNIPSKGYGTVTEYKDNCEVLINGKTVETKLLRVEFDDNWIITSIFDKENCREVLKNGLKGNELRVYADHPDSYDAWEWQEYSKDSYTVLEDYESAEVVTDGIRKGIKIIRRFRNSVIEQTVWFSDETALIDFDTVVSWQEHHIMLKAAFPVDINADKATYEIQFGSTERPMHYNTSWDRAKFEVCAQKYADVSDGGYGVSLINDCKYGHDIHDGVMMLSLLRCATWPYPEADIGEHKFKYALYPHCGTLTQSDTVKQAYYYNNPMTAIKACGSKTMIRNRFSAVKLDRENIVAETVKVSEDSNDIIIRLYESQNRKCSAEILTDFDFDEAYLCDMSENNIMKLNTENKKIKLDFGGFEIHTVKLIRNN